jgi:hypothetical protein
MRIRPGLLTNFSLDAPIVGTLWLALFARAYHVPISAEMVWLLFSSIWSVYAIDRLTERDSSRMQDRHNFHIKHAAVFWSIALGIGVLNIVFIGVCPLEPTIYIGAAILGSGAVLYLFLSMKLKTSSSKEWVKNTLVSFIFSLGCTLPVWTPLIVNAQVSYRFCLEMVSLVLLVFCNLRFIEANEAEKHPFPREIAAPGILILAIAIGLPSQLTLVWVVSLLLMAGIRLTRLSTRTAYDIALMIPAAITLAAGI